MGEGEKGVGREGRRISIIAAMARNGTIGVNNSLPWRLPEDLRHFKALTMGHHVVMGRKTYQSIGRPLPGRTTIIVTRDTDYRADGCLTAPSLEAAITLCGDDPEVYFVGGADIYRQALALADRLYLTEIQADFQGDARFPDFDRAVWREMERTERVDDGGLAYQFAVYDRIRSE
jgi:dihydrofolate reductase